MEKKNENKNETNLATETSERDNFLSGLSGLQYRMADCVFEEDEDDAEYDL